jgi:K+ transporter
MRLLTQFSINYKSKKGKKKNKKRKKSSNKKKKYKSKSRRLICRKRKHLRIYQKTQIFLKEKYQLIHKSLLQQILEKTLPLQKSTKQITITSNTHPYKLTAIFNRLKLLTSSLWDMLTQENLL